MRETTKENLKRVGFSKQVQNVEENKCPLCGTPINMDDFKDPLSVKEFNISGMCQKCQDSFW